MEVHIITQGASLERKLKIKKKKIKENTIEYNQKKETDLRNENKTENTTNEINNSSDEDELISFTSNYDLIKQNKNHDLSKSYSNNCFTKNEAFEKLIDSKESNLFLYFCDSIKHYYES
jgi:hypothetical protein